MGSPWGANGLRGAHEKRRSPFAHAPALPLALRRIRKLERCVRRVGGCEPIRRALVAAGPADLNYALTPRSVEILLPGTRSAYGSVGTLVTASTSIWMNCPA